MLRHSRERPWPCMEIPTGTPTPAPGLPFPPLLQRLQMRPGEGLGSTEEAAEQEPGRRKAKAPAMENVCLLWRSPPALLARRRRPQLHRRCQGGTKTPKKSSGPPAELHSTKAHYRQGLALVPTEGGRSISWSSAASPSSPHPSSLGTETREGPTPSHTIPTRKHPRPQKKSQQPLGIYFFFLVAFHILSSFTFS